MHDGYTVKTSITSGPLTQALFKLILFVFNIDNSLFTGVKSQIKETAASPACVSYP